MNTIVTGSVIVGPLVAKKKVDTGSDEKPTLLQQGMSYVLEPFDSIHEDWYKVPNHDDFNLAMSSVSDGLGGPRPNQIKVVV